MIAMRIVIEEGQGEDYFCSNGIWKSHGKKNYKLFSAARNNAILSWIDINESQDGNQILWTETQVFSLSHVNNGTLDLIWTRHVNNIRDENDDATWHISGQGTLKKSTDSSQQCSE